MLIEEKVLTRDDALIYLFVRSRSP